MWAANKLYQDWLALRISRRKVKLNAAPGVSFSVLTSVYARTNPALLVELSETVLTQPRNLLEWIVVAHGPIPAVLERVIEQLGSDGRCIIQRIERNLGPMGGLRYCLERARGEYVSPVDSDDLLTLDALSILGMAIELHGRPAFVYSDEDHWDKGAESPFLRWQFDPVLLTASSYIWHLCAIRRDVALELDLYTDLAAEWCHDWDTAIRIHQAGLVPVHVPEVLYHWRRHAESSTNRPDPESGSLLSQRSVLERIIRSSGHPELFEVRAFPLFRGSPEWYIARRPESPARADLIVWGYDELSCANCVCAALRSSGHPIDKVYVLGAQLCSGDRERIRALLGDPQGERVIDTPIRTIDRLKEVISKAPPDYIVFCHENVCIESSQWLWECDGQMRLHHDLEIIAGRVLDANRRILAAAEVFGFNGVAGSPDAGRAEGDPGYFAMALKPRSCSAPYSELFVARCPALLERMAGLPQCATLDSLGVWLGGLANEAGARVAFSPLLTGVKHDLGDSGRVRLSSTELDTFVPRFGRSIPDLRCYAADFGWTSETAFRVAIEV